MESKVHFSILSKTLTALTLLALIGCMCAGYNDPQAFALLGLILVILLAVGFYYCPREIIADDKALRVRRWLSKDKVFPYSEITGIELCYPSLGGLRLCGSGGFMGYWGYFHDISIGTFFGYYGDRDQCFVIRLRNGRQYVLSCTDPGGMVHYVEPNLTAA